MLSHRVVDENLHRVGCANPEVIILPGHAELHCVFSWLRKREALCTPEQVMLGVPTLIRREVRQLRRIADDHKRRYVQRASVRLHDTDIGKVVLNSDKVWRLDRSVS